MAKEGSKITGDDASYMKPKFVPDDELMGRDDSGGPDFKTYTQEFGDGGRVTGDKAHLSVSGGSDDESEGGVVEESERTRSSGEKSSKSKKGYKD